MTTLTAAPVRLPVRDHVREATRRAVRAAVAVALCTVVGFVLADPVMDLLRAPVEQLAATRDASLNYDTVTGAFDLTLRIALFTGVVLASPVWLYELLAFVAPGLTRRERRYTFGFLGAALPLFLGGCVLGLVLFPHMVELLTSFASTDDSTILSAAYYVDFVMKIVLATGIAFVLPVFLVVLNLLGMLSSRTLARSWRIAVIAIVAFSALVTPSADVLSMFAVALPMTALFGAALAVTHLHDRAVARRERSAACSA